MMYFILLLFTSFAIAAPQDSINHYPTTHIKIHQNQQKNIQGKKTATPKTTTEKPKSNKASTQLKSKKTVKSPSKKQMVQKSKIISKAPARKVSPLIRSAEQNPAKQNSKITTRATSNLDEIQPISNRTDILIENNQGVASNNPRNTIDDKQDGAQITQPKMEIIESNAQNSTLRIIDTLAMKDGEECRSKGSNREYWTCMRNIMASRIIVDPKNKPDAQFNNDAQSYIDTYQEKLKQIEVPTSEVQQPEAPAHTSHVITSNFANTDNKIEAVAAAKGMNPVNDVPTTPIITNPIPNVNPIITIVTDPTSAIPPILRQNFSTEARQAKEVKNENTKICEAMGYKNGGDDAQQYSFHHCMAKIMQIKERTLGARELGYIPYDPEFIGQIAPFYDDIIIDLVPYATTSLSRRDRLKCIDQGTKYKECTNNIAKYKACYNKFIPKIQETHANDKINCYVRAASRRIQNTDKITEERRGVFDSCMQFANTNLKVHEFAEREVCNKFLLQYGTLKVEP